MKRFFKGFGIVLGSLLGLILGAGLALDLIGSYRLNKTYDFPASELVIPTDAASIAYGQHRVETLCADCHGADLSGINNWFKMDPLGSVDSANLTAGEGGVGRTFSDEDYVRALRHGIDQQGKPIYMPAVFASSRLSDQDLAAIIAYIKTVPPVDHQTNSYQFTPVAKILLAAGVLGKLPVEGVSHEVSVAAAAQSVSPAYGEYLVDINDCRTCHGADLSGGRHPDPSVKALVPDITPSGEPGDWTEEQFITAIRTGNTPEQAFLNPQWMPWPSYRRMTDDELKAIWLYLHALPKQMSEQ